MGSASWRTSLDLISGTKKPQKRLLSPPKLTKPYLFLALRSETHSEPHQKQGIAWVRIREGKGEYYELKSVIKISVGDEGVHLPYRYLVFGWLQGAKTINE